jgi:hypothetical protein
VALTEYRSFLFSFHDLKLKRKFDFCKPFIKNIYIYIYIYIYIFRNLVKDTVKSDSLSRFRSMDEKL